MQPFSRMFLYFMEVARQGSVRKASEQLNVSASSIDRQILNAEEMLGVALFDRLPRGMKLTSAGEAFVKAGKGWQREFEKVRQHVDDLVGLQRGYVHIAAIESVAQNILSDVVVAMRRQYPGIFLDIDILPNHAIGAAITRGEYDLGIFLNPQSHKDLTIRAFHELGFGLALPPRHPLAEKSQARFSDLVGLELIRPDERLEIGGLLEVLEARHDTRIDGVMSSSDLDMIRELVMQGVGVAIMSELEVSEYVKAGRMAFVPLHDAALGPATLVIGHSKQAQLSYAAARFLQIFQQQVPWSAS
ncbi:LysR family transcriptional regulator [Carnimonas nigrificans]|uniref:LysR family transcriptional regulator n=1 Tax=Carnimonas nigrificans TaxID=64323 RepID=UPI00046F198C|nr:LysR family transcriptional regulator [Carnimonas nigrificans]